MNRRTYYHRNWPGSYYLNPQPSASYSNYTWPQNYYLNDGPGLAQPLAAATGMVAVEGVVVSYDPATMKLVVTVGNADKTYDLAAKIHVHDVDGSDLQAKDRAAKFKKGVPVTIEEKNGHVVQLGLKKK